MIYPVKCRFPLLFVNKVDNVRIQCKSYIKGSNSFNTIVRLTKDERSTADFEKNLMGPVTADLLLNH